MRRGILLGRMDSEVTVKGQAFHSVLAAVASLRGEAFRDRLAEALPGEAGNAVRTGALLPSGWYSVGWYRALLRCAVEEADGAPGFAREIGLTSGRREVRGLYRIMFRMLATETLVRQAPRFYDMFYRGGRAQVTLAMAGQGAVRYSDCHGFDYLVWQDLMGGAQAGFEATGARNLVMRAEDGGKDGDAGMLVSVRWAV